MKRIRRDILPLVFFYFAVGLALFLGEIQRSGASSVLQPFITQTDCEQVDAESYDPFVVNKWRKTKDEVALDEKEANKIQYNRVLMSKLKLIG